MTQLKERADDQQRKENEATGTVKWTWEFNPIFPGPYVEEFKSAFPALWRKGTTIGAWNTDATVANHFRTILVPDPTDPKFGVWGLASTARDLVDQQVKNGDAVPGGWWYRVADRVPTSQEWKAATYKGAQIMQPADSYFQAYYETHPNEDPAVKAAADLKALQVIQGLKAIELTVYGGGTIIFVAKDEAESQAEDGPHPGVSILAPGAWAQASGGKAPGAFNLPGPYVTTIDGSNPKVADEEYQSIVVAANGGSWKAKKALAYMGQGPDPGPAPTAGGNPFAALLGR